MNSIIALPIIAASISVIHDYNSQRVVLRWCERTKNIRKWTGILSQHVDRSLVSYCGNITQKRSIVLVKMIIRWCSRCQREANFVYIQLTYLQEGLLFLRLIKVKTPRYRCFFTLIVSPSQPLFSIIDLLVCDESKTWICFRYNRTDGSCVLFFRTVQVSYLFKRISAAVLFKIIYVKG